MDFNLYETKMKVLFAEADRTLKPLLIEIFENRKPQHLVKDFGEILLNEEDLKGTFYSNYEYIEFHYNYFTHFSQIYYKLKGGIGSSYISHCTADIVYKADMFYLLKDILLKKEITTLKEE
jgi:hypothetical protein|uniref:Uncharacterized protein n=1 Tax=Myoviridae sp. ctPuP5 TaxID=2823543 RepID=A0A8S5L9Y7_9CAUD|nr:MAG TPA: hypothetical protein [Myoviridae sp. ctPuP5]